MPSPKVVIVGAGPAGLMAAEVLARGGAQVVVHERMPSPARRLLMAGRGGLNLTHSEALADMLGRYGDRSSRLAPLLAPEVDQGKVHAMLDAELRTVLSDMFRVRETWWPLAPCATKRCAHSGRSVFSSSPAAMRSSHTRASISCGGRAASGGVAVAARGARPRAGRRGAAALPRLPRRRRRRRRARGAEALPAPCAVVRAGWRRAPAPAARGGTS
jgi:choline dehydrogenase-like flavoprotein